MKNEVENINQSALEALCRNESYQAQSLFRQNAKDNPCFMTLNNLGVFYAFEGITLKSGKIRNAVKLGINILKKAASMESSVLNLTAIANTYLKANNMCEAIRFYEQANKIANNYALFNNYGVALYLSNLYEKSSALFFKALDCCDNIDDEQEIIVSYAYALLETDKKKCHKIVGEKMNSKIFSSQMLDADKLILLYFCGDFQAVSEIYASSIMSRHSIDIFMFAMIIDCLFKLGKKEEAEKFLYLQNQSLQGYDYDTRKDLEDMDMAFFSKDYRDEVISKYRYIPSIIEQCCYCGCKQHNPFPQF